MNATIAQKILAGISYATIATTNTQGDPWNTPVFYASDGLTIYWSSHPDSVHSKNIAANGKAFIVIYNSKAGEGEGVGLYGKAIAQVVADAPETRQALGLLGKRRGKLFKIEKYMQGPQRIYKAELTELWINDAEQDTDGDFIKDFRIKL